MTNSAPRFYAGSFDAPSKERKPKAKATAKPDPTVVARPTTKKVSEASHALERLEARLHAEQKNLFMRAASLSGVSLTSFVVEAAAERARQVIYEHDVMRLSAADSEAFANALVEDTDPSDRLVRAAQRYRAKTGA